MGLAEKALKFAEEAHKNQVRKYTGEPYVNHCKEVAEKVKSIGGTDEMVAAALLHDTVEDCGVLLETVSQEFGAEVCDLVFWLTDISTPADGNRTARKKMDREHTAKATPDAKTIKLADLISNTKSIVQHDKDFARIYLKEKEALLHVLTEGDQSLYDEAVSTLIYGKLALMDTSPRSEKDDE